MRGEKKADIDVYKPSCGHRDMEYWTEHVVLRERDKRHGNGGTTVNGKRTEVEYEDSDRVGISGKCEWTSVCGRWGYVIVRCDA